MAIFSSNAMFGTTVLFMVTISIYMILIFNRIYDDKNEKYTKLSYLIVLYSLAASLILYGFSLYFFSAFPTHGSVFICMMAIVLFAIQSLTVLITQWRVANIREKISGGMSNNLTLNNFPSLMGSIIAIVIGSTLSLISFSVYTYYRSDSIMPNAIFFATIPILIAFSIFSSSQALLNLKNITGLFN